MKVTTSDGLQLACEDNGSINYDMIEAASKRLAPTVRETPLLNAPFLDEMAGRRLWLKAENLQHTGSFKFRGGWSALSGLPENLRKNGVIAYSSGNHAQGVAKAAAAYGVTAVILMPSDAPKSKIDNTRALGAEVVLYDRLTESRVDLGREIAKKRGLTLVKPFDDPLVIAGQGTVGIEIARQASHVKKADVLVPCGGGGLTSGIALVLEELAPNLCVRTVEPEGFDDVARSLISGKHEVNAAQGGSICDAIVTPTPGALTFPIMKKLCGKGIAVSDTEALQAVALAFQHLRIVLEPGGAVALAAALFHPDEIEGDDVIVVATGGNVDAAVFIQALQTVENK